MGAKFFRAVNCEMSKDEKVNNKQMFKQSRQPVAGNMMEDLTDVAKRQCKGNKFATKAKTIACKLSGKRYYLLQI